MNLYLVKTRDGKDLWVAHETADGDIFVYVPNTGKFHSNPALGEDFYVDREFTYELVDESRARELVDEGVVGKMDGRVKAAQLARYKADENVVDPRELLGISRKPSPREIIRARARALQDAAPGTVVTWKSYPLADRHLALVAANGIRRGKVKALAPLGELDVRTEERAGEVHVRIAKVQAVASTRDREL